MLKNVCVSVIAMAALIGFIVPVLAASEIEFRIALEPAPPHPWVDTADFIAREISRKTDGRITVAVHHSAGLGKAEAVFEQMAGGDVDLAMHGFATMIPEASVLSYPFLFKDNEQFSQAVGGNSLAMAFLQKSFADRKPGIRLMAIGGGSTVQLSNRLRPITVPGDLEGLAMRISESAPERRLWEYAGAVVIPASWDKVDSMLRAGAADAFESTSRGYYGGRLYEAAKYHSKTQHQYMTTGVYMSDSSFAKLSRADRDVLILTCFEAGVFLTGKGLEYNDALLREMVDRNLAVVNEVDRDAFREFYAPLHDELAREEGCGELLRLIREAGSKAF